MLDERENKLIRIIMLMTTLANDLLEKAVMFRLIDLFRLGGFNDSLENSFF